MQNWITLSLTSTHATAQLSDGRVSKAQTLTWPISLRSFRDAVGRDAVAGEPVGAATRDAARALFVEVFRDKIRDLVNEHRNAAAERTLLVRIAVGDQALADVPWEGLDTGPNEVLGTAGPLAGSPFLHVVRQTEGGAPPRPEPIVGRVRVLVLAATRTGVVTGVEQALQAAIEGGAIDPLDVIPETQVATLTDLRMALEQRSAPRRRPHVLHIIGHGAVSDDAEPEPILVLPGDAGESVSIPIRELTDILVTCFGDHLRLIVLDSCDGAKQSPNGSAAEALAQRAAVAVLAHLWPLDTQTARAVAKSFYSALTLSPLANGDVAAALSRARNELARTSAAAFSPVLYLRGESPRLFDFSSRLRPMVPRPPRPDGQAQALADILKTSFSLLLGDPGEDLVDWYETLRVRIAEKLDAGSAVSSLADTVQRYVLAKGRDQLAVLFQEVFDELLNENRPPITPLTAALAEVLRPGIHATLLWVPVLEHALAARHPDRTIYVVQPPLTSDHADALWVMRRRAHEDAWITAESWRKDIDPDEDYVVIRANGGYLPTNILRGALFTDEDFAQIDWKADMPPGWNRLIGMLRDAPVLLVGISILSWRHRTAVRGLFDLMLPKGSVAVLSPSAEEFEDDVWRKRGGGLGDVRGTPVAVVRLGADALAEQVLEGAS